MLLCLLVSLCLRVPYSIFAHIHLWNVYVIWFNLPPPGYEHSVLSSNNNNLTPWTLSRIYVSIYSRFTNMSHIQDNKTVQLIFIHAKYSRYKLVDRMSVREIHSTGAGVKLASPFPQLWVKDPPLKWEK